MFIVYNLYIGNRLAHKICCIKKYNIKSITMKIQLYTPSTYTAATNVALHNS